MTSDKKPLIMLCISLGEPLDQNFTKEDISPIFSGPQFGCPSPQPFIQNTNSSVAYLSANIFNGTQPEDAGNYTCLADGIPRATVEIIVLGTFINFVHQIANGCVSYC